MGYLKPIEGNIEITDKTDISYYAQEHEILDTNKTILDNFKNFGLADYEIRRILGSFYFPETIYTKTFQYYHQVKEVV